MKTTSSRKAHRPSHGLICPININSKDICWEVWEFWYQSWSSSRLSLKSTAVYSSHARSHKGTRKQNIWELLYTDDLVLTADTEEAAGNRFNEWKTLLEKRGMKVNLEKTKVMALGRSPSEKKGSGQYPCSICSKGVGSNSIKCRTCDLWCHKRCSGLQQSLKKIEDTFECPTCSRRLTEKQNQKSNCLRVNGDKLDMVDDFCYLGVMSCDSGAESAVRARIAAAWKKWREIAGLWSAVNRTRAYQACIRPVLLYGGETPRITKRLEQLLRSCDLRMLRCIAKIRRENRISIEEVLNKCRLEEISSVLRKRRLRWFGHVKRREENSILRRAMNLQINGRKPVGRPKKPWQACIKEDLKLLNISEEAAHDRMKWWRLIACLTPMRRKGQ